MTSSNSKRRALIGVLLALAVGAGATDGVYEIAQSAMPLVITNSGSYRVTENLAGVAGTNGITILVGEVRLDLNGFTLRGVPGSANGIYAESNLFDIAILNGIVRDWGGDGVNIGGVSNAVVRDVLASGNANSGFSIGFNSVVGSCLAFLNGGFPGPAPTFTNTLGHGLGVENGSAIRRCLGWRSSSHGYIGHSGSTVEESIFWGNGHDGLHASHASLIKNCLAGENSEGMEVDSGSLVSQCVSVHNQDDGYRMGSGGFTIQQSLAGAAIYGSVGAANGSATSGNGVDLRGAGRVVGCVVYSNLDHGVRGTTNNQYVASTLALASSVAGTKSGIKLGETGARVERNHSVGHYYGISIGGSGNVLLNNSALGNARTNYDISGGNHYDLYRLAAPTNNLRKDAWANFDL